MGSVIAISGVAILALAITLFRGPWQGGALVIGGVLIGVGLWIQRRKSIDWSSAASGESDRLKDCLPGKIGGDPRTWLEKRNDREARHIRDTESDDD